MRIIIDIIVIILLCGSCLTMTLPSENQPQMWLRSAS